MIGKGLRRMRLIEGSEKHHICILEDKDIVEVMTIRGNTQKLQMKCINNTLHIEEIPYKTIKNMNMELKEIKKIKDYFKFNKKNI